MMSEDRNLIPVTSDQCLGVFQGKECKVENCLCLLLGKPNIKANNRIQIRREYGRDPVHRISFHGRQRCVLINILRYAQGSMCAGRLNGDRTQMPVFICYLQLPPPMTIGVAEKDPK